MDAATPQLLPYRELFRRQSVRNLRETDIPSDAAISLGLPTFRCGGPGYAYFAAPAVRRPGDPVVQKAPDRWWVLDARTGALLLYARVSAVPFAKEGWDGDTTLPQTTATLDEQRAAHARVSGLIDRLAPFFFRNESVARAERDDLKAALAAMIPEPLMPHYRTLVPDFFTWLDA